MPGGLPLPRPAPRKPALVRRDDDAPTPHASGKHHGPRVQELVPGWAGECTSFPREIAEAALAHVVGDETERAYRRGDALEKRRKLMEAWSGFLAAPKESSIVVQFSGRE